MMRANPLGHAAELLMIALAGGCGVSVTTDFPNRVIGSDGQPIVLEDLEDIVGDDDLSDEEKRTALRELGLDDETLISALLSL